MHVIMQNVLEYLKRSWNSGVKKDYSGMTVKRLRELKLLLEVFKSKRYAKRFLPTIQRKGREIISAAQVLPTADKTAVNHKIGNVIFPLEDPSQSDLEELTSVAISTVDALLERFKRK